MPLNTFRLFGTTLLVMTPCYPSVQAAPQDQEGAKQSIKKQFPILSNPSVPTIVPLAHKTLSHAFPKQTFFVLLFRQYPVARQPPEPLGSQNLFVVDHDGRVRHLKDAQSLEEFFRTTLNPVGDGESAKEDVEAWLRLSQQFRQDGFFKFSIPHDTLVAEKTKVGWSALGKAIVMEGGRGELRAALIFTEAGKLARIEQTSTVKAGIRPICQATKLLDADPVVRQMAEKDILVMGHAAKEYLEEQRTTASPELKQAIDRIWRRIMKEGW